MAEFKGDLGEVIKEGECFYRDLNEKYPWQLAILTLKKNGIETKLQGEILGKYHFFSLKFDEIDKFGVRWWIDKDKEAWSLKERATGGIYLNDFGYQVGEPNEWVEAIRKALIDKDFELDAEYTVIGKRVET